MTTQSLGVGNTDRVLIGKIPGRGRTVVISTCWHQNRKCMFGLNAAGFCLVVKILPVQVAHSNGYSPLESCVSSTTSLASTSKHTWCILHTFVHEKRKCRGTLIHNARGLAKGHVKATNNLVITLCDRGKSNKWKSLPQLNTTVTTSSRA